MIHVLRETFPQLAQNLSVIGAVWIVPAQISVKPAKGFPHRKLMRTIISE